jgi:triosephosphate isomerase
MTNNKIYFIANWKMYGKKSSIMTLNNVIKLSKISKYKMANIIYCPPYTLLEQFVKKTKKSKIVVGAQNCHNDENYGAYTGSINTKMIKDTGSKFVIIGHSESRQAGDTNSLINLKIKSAIKQKLNIIFCIGESLRENKKKKTIIILSSQIKNGLKNIKNIDKIIFAYEPLWSIGTGVIPKSKDLENRIKVIRNFIIKNYKIKNPRILYGGSVNPDNIVLLNKIPFISGFLIGGASLDSKKFIDIIKKTIN